MADEADKTEEASPRKIEKAREEGNVPKSPETSSFVSLLVAFAVLFIFFPFVTDSAMNLYRYYVSLIGQELNKELAINIAITSILQSAKILAPFAIALIVAGIIGNVAQIGFLFTAKAIAFKPSKINPVSGLKNLFSLKKLLDGVIITLKVFAALGVGFFVFYLFMKELATVSLFPLIDQMHWFVDKLLILVGILMLLFFILAAVDLFIKRYQYFKSLRMSKQEVKDEYKQMEGNPEIKRKIRQTMMQMGMKRMMSSIPEADVVVTNPTHYAVALRYDQLKDRAPRVLAKGVDHLALRIKEVAREHDILIVQNKPLAQDLYKMVDVDKTIPEELFQAVAEVLAYVYKANKGKNV